MFNQIIDDHRGSGNTYILRAPWIMILLLLLLFIHYPSPSSASTTYSGNTYILFPDVHRSGGPACLHALNSALNEIGISSFMFFVNPQYANKHTQSIVLPNFPTSHYTTLEQVQSAKPRLLSHLISILTPNDFVIIPTHSIGSQGYFTSSNFQKLSATGARTIVYLLGVAFPYDSEIETNNGHGLVVGFHLRDVTHQFAPILPLSHYIHKYFHLPHRSHYVAMSPLENIYYIHHRLYMEMSKKERRAGKKNVILIDSDLQGDLWLPQDIIDQYEIVLLNGKSCLLIFFLPSTFIFTIILFFQ